MNPLSAFLTRRRRLARRRVLSEIAKKGHSTRIRKQFLRDPLIREMKEASNPQSPLASSTQ